MSPSSSCVGAVREVYPALAREAGDERFEREARELGERVFELSEFLVRRLGVEDVGAAFPHRVTYHPPAIRCACARSVTRRCACCANVRGP